MTKSALNELGGFDEALGAGSPCGGGEDLDMFMRVILAGHRIVYEPSAIISHVHRADLAQLTKQMVAYGAGCTAALTAIVMRHPRARTELVTRLASGVTRIFKISDRVQGNPALPSGLMSREVRGMPLGPGCTARDGAIFAGSAAVGGVGRRHGARPPHDLRNYRASLPRERHCAPTVPARRAGSGQRSRPRPKLVRRVRHEPGSRRRRLSQPGQVAQQRPE